MTVKQNRFVDFVQKQNYIKELSVVEHIILWTNVVTATIFLILQLTLSNLHLYAEWTTWVAFFASVTSIFATMAGAKQRILCPFLGIVASIMLIFVAWWQGLYGSVIMYAFNIIMQTTSFIIWYKESKDKVTIQPNHAKLWMCFVYIAVFVALTGLFAWVEGVEGFYTFWSGGQQTQPSSWHVRIFDSAVLMFTIAGFIPMVKKYDQVWWIYIIADVSIAILWLIKGIENTDPTQQYQIWSTFTSGFCMTATCIVGIINWQKSLRNIKKS